MYGGISAMWPLSDSGRMVREHGEFLPERFSHPAEPQDSTDLSAGRACDNLSAPTTEPEMQA